MLLKPESKKVVLISPEVPHPVFKGNQNRIDVSIRLLASLGLKVYVVIQNSYQQGRSVSSIIEELKSVYSDVEDVFVFQHGKRKRCFSSIRKRINIIREGYISNESTCPVLFRDYVEILVGKINPQFIFINYARLAKVIPKKFDGKIVLDAHDLQTNLLTESISAGFKKSNKINISKYKRDEILELSKFDTIISINETESQFMRSVVSSAVVTIPAFSKVEDLYSARREKRYDLLFVGSSSNFNKLGIEEFIKFVYPALRQKFPHIKIAIAGDVSNFSFLKGLNDKNIDILGRVEDLRCVYEESKVFISPITKGAGMKVKNVEALSYGLPLVATKFSMSGMVYNNNIDCAVVENWDGFERAIVSMILDDSKRTFFSRNAIKVAKEHYSFESACRKYIDLFL